MVDGSGWWWDHRIKMNIILLLDIMFCYLQFFVIITFGKKKRDVHVENSLAFQLLIFSYNLHDTFQYFFDIQNPGTSSTEIILLEPMSGNFLRRVIINIFTK